MKLSERIYKVSGVEYRTNSNMYVIQYDRGLIMIDTGFQEEQWERMTTCMNQWGLRLEDVTHVFITHSHFDHAGNVWRANLLGAEVLSSSADAEKIENGNPEMEELFGTAWRCGKVNKVIKGGDVFEFPGKVKIEVIETPGHSEGSLSYRISDGELKALCTGDMFFIRPEPPKDDVGIELGYMGSSDFSLEKFQQSLKQISSIDADLLLPGHYYTYRSANVKEICRMAYDAAENL